MSEIEPSSSNTPAVASNTGNQEASDLPLVQQEGAGAVVAADAGADLIADPAAQSASAPISATAPLPSWQSTAATAAPATPAAPAAPEARSTRRFGTGAVAGTAAASLVLGAVVGGAAGAGMAAWTMNGGMGSGTTQLGVAAPQTITINNSQSVDLASAVAAKAMPSVVTVSVRTESGGGTGSGVVVDNSGHIVTNTHVVTLDGATGNATVTVTTSDGRVLPATVVGTDPLMDLAVIKVDASADLPPIEFADSRKLNVGANTVAIGAPLGLNGTVTRGIISALNRSITVASSAAPQETSPETPGGGEMPGEGNGSDGGGGQNPGDPFDFFNFNIPGAPTNTQASGTIQLPVIQTDTAINPGNSGGALLDDNARLVGINVAIATAGSSGSSGDIGIGFAIPANVVQRVTSELINTGAATHGLLGASVANATDDPAQATAGLVGASIVQLSVGGAAQAAGLNVGDLVTNLDGVPIANKGDLTAQVRSHAAGATVPLTYVRGGKTNTVDVTLGALQ